MNALERHPARGPRRRRRLSSSRWSSPRLLPRRRSPPRRRVSRRCRPGSTAVYTQVSVAVEKYNQATSQLDSVELKIKQNQHLLDVAEHNLRTANQQLTVRAETLYKSRDVGIVDVLFKADSFDELVTQLDMMNRIGNSDVDTVKAIAAYRRDIKDRRVKLDADKEAAAKLVAERAAQKDQIVALESKLEEDDQGPQG